MQVWQGYIMASVIYQWMFMANISSFHKFDNLAAILNILAYFSQTQPEMHVHLNFYVHTHHKDSKKPVYRGYNGRDLVKVDVTGQNRIDLVKLVTDQNGQIWSKKLQKWDRPCQSSCDWA